MDSFPLLISYALEKRNFHTAKKVMVCLLHVPVMLKCLSLHWETSWRSPREKTRHECCVRNDWRANWRVTFNAFSASHEIGHVLLKKKIIMVGITLHNAAEVSARGNRKPAIILDYNTNNRRVDKSELPDGLSQYSTITLTYRGENKNGEVSNCHCRHTSIVWL